jgi:hypothetical protein
VILVVLMLPLHHNWCGGLLPVVDGKRHPGVC